MKLTEIYDDNQIGMKFKRIFKSYSFFFLFLILGSVLFLLIILALLDISIKQLVFNFDNFIKTTQDQEVIQIIWLTFYAGLMATLITIIFGTPLAYVVAHYRFKGKSIINAIMNIPLMIPHSVAGVLIFSLFYRYGWIGEPLLELGITFERNIFGTIAALLFVSMPIYINNVRDGFQSINPHLSSVAKSLGATERRIFIRIMLPLNKRHIITGAVMCWARAISDLFHIIQLSPPC